MSVRLYGRESDWEVGMLWVCCQFVLVLLAKWASCLRACGGLGCRWRCPCCRCCRWSEPLGLLAWRLGADGDL